MALYMINTLFVYFSSLFASHTKQIDINRSTQKPHIIFCLMAFFSLTLIGGLRYNVGTDYATYSIVYLKYANCSFAQIIHSFEPGFALICWLLGKLSQDPQMMFFLFSTVTNLFIILTLREYCRPYEIGTFLFLGTFFFYNTFDLVRQCLVASILFWHVRDIIEKKFLKYIITALILSSIHSSALVMIPVCFIARQKVWGKWYIISFLAAILLFATYRYYTEILGSILTTIDSKYQVYTLLLILSKGTNFLRLPVYALPLILAFIYRKKIHEEWPELECFINIYYIGFLVMILALQNLYFARIAILMTLYQLVILPYIIKIMSKKIRPILYFGIIICYLFYSIMLIPENANVLPYQSIIN